MAIVVGVAVSFALLQRKRQPKAQIQVVGGRCGTRSRDTEIGIGPFQGIVVGANDAARDGKLVLASLEANQALLAIIVRVAVSFAPPEWKVW